MSDSPLREEFFAKVAESWGRAYKLWSTNSISSGHCGSFIRWFISTRTECHVLRLEGEDRD